MEQRRCAGCMAVTEGHYCHNCGWPAEKNNEPHQLPVGTVLRGQYMVGRVLGQGGFGITYIGWDMAAETAVAIKEFFPSSTVNRDISQSRSVRVNTDDMRPHYLASKERFLREANALVRFKDIPEVVDILDFARENNTAYIVMEFVEGQTLKDLLAEKGPMTWEQAKDVFLPAFQTQFALSFLSVFLKAEVGVERVLYDSEVGVRFDLEQVF